MNRGGRGFDRFRSDVAAKVDYTDATAYGEIGQKSCGNQFRRIDQIIWKGRAYTAIVRKLPEWKVKASPSEYAMNPTVIADDYRDIFFKIRSVG